MYFNVTNLRFSGGEKLDRRKNQKTNKEVITKDQEKQMYLIDSEMIKWIGKEV